MAWLWGLFIFILCILPASAAPHSGWLAFPGADKWVHAILFGVLSIFVVLSLRIGSRFRYAVVICAAYGLLIECVQKFVFTWRSGDWLDWLADLGGTVIALTLFSLFPRNKKPV